MNSIYSLRPYTMIDLGSLKRVGWATLNAEDSRAHKHFHRSVYDLKFKDSSVQTLTGL